MSQFTNHGLLGEILSNAGLISSSQVQIALIDQKNYQDLKLGEILALRGWIEQKTADFFAEDWKILIKQPAQYPLGYYLEKSGLLTEKQIASILKEQKQLWIKFGHIAILQGYIEQNTLDFFLDNLFTYTSSESSSIGSKMVQKTDNSDQSTESEIDYEDIPWID